MYRRFGLDPSDPESLIVVSGDRVLRDSDAVLAIWDGLGGVWGLAAKLRVIPRALRDPLYRWIARNRYRIFGKRETCWIPSPGTFGPDVVMRILVIGGYGGFGAKLSRRLAAAGHHLIIAGRDAAKAELFCREFADAEPLRLDRTWDIGPALAQVRPDLMIDAAGPFQHSDYRVPWACIDAGVSYLDLADAREFVAGIGSLDADARAAGVVVISGASTLPALSGAVVRKLTGDLDRVDQVHTALSGSTWSTGNESVVRAILSYVGKPLPLWRAGRRTLAYGWQGLRRERYEIEGVRPLKRWVGMADVPDLDLLPPMLPGNPNVEFRAGTDVAVHMFFLWLASWAVRCGLVPSLEPASGWLRRVQRATAFGRGDRSAMQIRVRGSLGGSGLERRWILVAERFEGPEIPTLAAALLAEDLARKRLSLGARDASEALELDRFERLFTTLAVTHEVTERSTPALYERVMGEEFKTLAPAVRRMHEVYGDAGAEGRGEVAIGSSAMARLICRIMRFPPAGSHPVHVAFGECDGVERWTRDFGGHRFSSVLRQRGPFMRERFGPLSFRFDLSNDNSGLKMELRGWSALGVPLPLAFAPRIEAAEWEEQGRFNFSVDVALPLIGRVIRYSGQLKRLGFEATDDTKRAARKVRAALA